MKKTGLVFLSAMLLFSCKSSGDIPFTELNHYFISGDVEVLPDNPKVNSEADFDSIFGAAAVMGKDGQPTPVDFGKEFVIAVLYPVTDVRTELAPVSLKKVDGNLVFSYRETLKGEQGFQTQPVLLVKVSREYETATVKLDKTQD